MDFVCIKVGFGNFFVLVNRIIAIIGPHSAPVKRIIQNARAHRELLLMLLLDEKPGLMEGE